MSKFFKLPMDIAERKDLTASDKLIFAVVCDCFRGKELCWPGKRFLSEKTGLSGQVVCDSIARLESAGLLVVERRGNGKSNHYKSGQESRPVKKLDRSKNNTTGGQESRPEAVRKVDPNKTDLLNKTENFPFSDVKPTPETPDPERVRRVFEALAI